MWSHTEECNEKVCSIPSKFVLVSTLTVHQRPDEVQGPAGAAVGLGDHRGDVQGTSGEEGGYADQVST